MQIVYAPTKYHKYAFEYNFSNELLDYCRELKVKHGWTTFNFEMSNKKWCFTDLEIAKEIKERYSQIIYDATVYRDLKKHEIEKAQEVLLVQKVKELKQATTSSLQIKGIKGELYDFQKLAIQFLISNNGNGFLSLDMGLGKTLCSLAYITHTKQSKSLVITPASVKYSWLNEVEKWTRLKALVINSKTDLSLKAYQENDILIINYDILKKHFDFLTSVRFDCLVVDESTYIKNIKTIRFKATKEISKKVNSIILLSGTPILNRVSELFSALNILDPKKWNDYYKYVTRYCNAFKSDWGGLDVSGSSNISELKEKIGRYIFRKRKEEVLTELPDKNFINIPIQLDDEIQAKYDLLEGDFINYLREVKKKKDKEIQKSLQAEKLVRLGALRELTTEGKLTASQEIIQNIIDSGEKVVVFSNFNKPLKVLKDIFKEKAVMIIGSTSEEERRSAIEIFQKDSNVQIFLGGMLSANTGITLTAASNVLFISLDYTPANMAQAWSRIDRIGQTASSINIYQLIGKNTIDQKLLTILAAKQALINELIEDDVNTNKTKGESVIKDLLSFYEGN